MYFGVGYGCIILNCFNLFWLLILYVFWSVWRGPWTRRLWKRTLAWISRSVGTNGTELWIDNVNLGGSAGVYEVFSNVNVNAYPNPTSDIITFDIEGIETATIELYNAAGAVVKNVNTTSSLTNISLGNVKAGNYFYTVKNAEGKIVRSGQVIKN